jgi:hypothetical protein
MPAGVAAELLWSLTGRVSIIEDCEAWNTPNLDDRFVGQER